MVHHWVRTFGIWCPSPYFASPFALQVDGREFGPFTPGLERNLGRAAQMGFLSLVLIEAAKGSSLF